MPTAREILTRRQPSINEVRNREAEKRQSTIDTPSVVIRNPTIRRGGGGGSNNSQSSFTNPTNNPILDLPAVKSAMAQQDAKTLAFQNAAREASARQSDSNFTILKGTPRNATSYGRGAFITSQAEQDALRAGGSTLPTFAISSDNMIGAFDEGSIAGSAQLSTPGGIFNPVITKAQFEYNVGSLGRARDQASYISNFQSNPESFVTSGEAFKTVTGGMITFTGSGEEHIDYITYNLNEQFFTDKFYSKEADLKYNKQGRDAFNTLPQSSKTIARTYGEIGAVGKFGLGVIDFGGSVVKTVLYSGEVRKDKPLYDLNIKEFKLPGPGLEGLRTLPSVQSVNPFVRVPLIGLEVPTTLGGIKEFGSRPEQVLTLAVTGKIGGDLVKGGVNAFKLYQSERLLGNTRLGALDVLGGETFASVVKINENSRIFAAKGKKLSPFETSQLNKGDLLTSVKIGQVGKADVFTTKGTSSTINPTTVDYLSYKPRLSGGGNNFNFKTVTAKEFQTINLKDNAFTISPTSKENVFNLKGQGKREVLTIKQEIYADTRYTLGTRNNLQFTTQSFESLGKAKVFNTPSGKQFSFSLDKTSFKNLERTTLFGSYKFGGKDFLPRVTREGKAFGLGISGRPTVTKGFGFDISTIKLGTDEGLAVFGKSFSKFSSKGRRGVQFFNTKTLIPKDNIFTVSGNPNFKPKDINPKGIKVTRLEQKPFDLLPRTSTVQKQIVDTKLIQRGSRSSLSPARTTLKTSEPFNTLSSPRTMTRLSQGLKTSTVFGSSFNTRQFSLQNTALSPAQAFRFNTAQALTPTEVVVSRYGLNTRQPNQFVPIVNPRSRINGFNFNTPIIGGFGGLPSLGGYALPNILGQGRKSKEVRIAPSFTGIVQNLKIKSPVKVSRSLGVTPFQTRGLLTGSGPYSKLVDF